jgi:alkylation response protein AidB-like acyl-CoA dehydrogenase
MLDFSFEDEDYEFRDLVREFAQKEIKPLGIEMDREYDREKFMALWRKAAEMGILGVMVPEAYGGVGGSPLSMILLVEELAAADAGFTGSLALNWGVQTILILVGSTSQMERYLPMISSDDAVPAAGCLTEPQGGSDVESVAHCGPGALRTTYRRENGGFVLNGTKCFITNGGNAGLYVVLATSDPNAGAPASSLFLVPADLPGVSTGRIEDKMGFRSSQTAEVIFDEVMVPDDHMLGDEGMGMDYVELAMIFTRWAVGLLAVGIARAAYEEALAYARERVQGGGPIIWHQGIGFKLADMATAIESGRSLAYKAAWASMQFDLEPEERFRLSCMAKYYCSDMAMKVCTEAVQVFGGYGYMKDYPVEKLMRDVKVTQIFEGPNELQRLDVLERL